MTETLVSVAQYAATDDKDKNLELAQYAISDAASRNARLVVLPELVSFFRPGDGIALARSAEGLDGPFLAGIASAAESVGLHVVIGVVEKIAGDDRVYNTVVAFDPAGRQLAAYRKVHPYDAFGYRESDTVRPAKFEPAVITVDDIRVGIQTCYDVRFPEITRALVDQDVDLVVLPAAWAAGSVKEDHWRTLVRTRAIENTIYVAASGQTAPSCTGGSIIVDPMGIVVADAGESPGVAVAPVSTERIQQVRQTNPSLENRRFRVSFVG